MNLVDLVLNSNEYLLAKIGVHTAENEPLEVWGKIFNIIHSCPYAKVERARKLDQLSRTLINLLEAVDEGEAGEKTAQTMRSGGQLGSST